MTRDAFEVFSEGLLRTRISAVPCGDFVVFHHVDGKRALYKRGEDPTYLHELSGGGSFQIKDLLTKVRTTLVRVEALAQLPPHGATVLFDYPDTNEVVRALRGQISQLLVRAEAAERRFTERPPPPPTPDYVVQDLTAQLEKTKQELIVAQERAAKMYAEAKEAAQKADEARRAVLSGKYLVTLADDSLGFGDLFFGAGINNPALNKRIMLVGLAERTADGFLDLELSALPTNGHLRLSPVSDEDLKKLKKGAP